MTSFLLPAFYPLRRAVFLTVFAVVLMVGYHMGASRFFKVNGYFFGVFVFAPLLWTFFITQFKLHKIYEQALDRLFFLNYFLGFAGFLFWDFFGDCTFFILTPVITLFALRSTPLERAKLSGLLLFPLFAGAMMFHLESFGGYQKHYVVILMMLSTVIVFGIQIFLTYDFIRRKNRSASSIFPLPLTLPGKKRFFLIRYLMNDPAPLPRKCGIERLGCDFLSVWGTFSYAELAVRDKISKILIDESPFLFDPAALLPGDSFALLLCDRCGTFNLRTLYRLEKVFRCPADILLPGWEHSAVTLADTVGFLARWEGTCNVPTAQLRRRLNYRTLRRVFLPVLMFLFFLTLFSVCIIT